MRGERLSTRGMDATWKEQLERGDGCYIGSRIGNDKVQCGLPELEKEVDDKIGQCIAWVGKHPNRRTQRAG